jgi:hypothetical protein
VKDEGAVVVCEWQTSQRIADRSGRFVIAVDEEEAPLPAKRRDALGTASVLQTDAIKNAAALHRLFDDRSERRIVVRGVDDIDRHAGQCQVRRRPSQPAADLQRPLPSELQADVVQQRGLVAIQKSHQREAIVGVPEVRHITAQVLPRMMKRVTRLHMRETVVWPHYLKTRRKVVA